MGVTAKIRTKPGGTVSSIRYERSNLTRLARSSAMVRLDCPICGICFERYACHAKRVNVSYCSRACAAEGAIVRFDIPCRTCGTDFQIIPSKIGILHSCSVRCRDEYRRKNRAGKRCHGWKEYAAAAMQVRGKHNGCFDCGTNIGPFLVRYTRCEDGASVDEIAKKMRVQCTKCRWIESLQNTPNHIKHRERK